MILRWVFLMDIFKGLSQPNAFHPASLNPMTANAVAHPVNVRGGSSFGVTDNKKKT